MVVDPPLLVHVHQLHQLVDLHQIEQVVSAIFRLQRSVFETGMPENGQVTSSIWSTGGVLTQPFTQLGRVGSAAIDAPGGDIIMRMKSEEWQRRIDPR